MPTTPDEIEIQVRWKRRYWLWIGYALMWPMQLFGKRAAFWWNDFCLLHGGCELKIDGDSEWTSILAPASTYTNRSASNASD